MCKQVDKSDSVLRLTQWQRHSPCDRFIAFLISVYINPQHQHTYRHTHTHTQAPIYRGYAHTQPVARTHMCALSSLLSQSLRQWKGQSKPIKMITNKNITHQAVGRGRLGWMACQACDIYKMNCKAVCWGNSVRLHIMRCRFSASLAHDKSHIGAVDWGASRKLDGRNWKGDLKGDAAEVDADSCHRRHESATRWTKMTALKVDDRLVFLTSRQIQLGQKTLKWPLWDYRHEKDETNGQQRKHWNIFTHTLTPFIIVCVDKL